MCRCAKKKNAARSIASNFSFSSRFLAYNIAFVRFLVQSSFIPKGRFSYSFECGRGECVQNKLSDIRRTIYSIEEVIDVYIIIK